MCNCSVGKIPARDLVADAILNDSNLRQTIMAQTIISKEGFQNKDAESVFLFLNCISPAKFQAAFKPYDIDIKTKEDIQGLAKIHKTGKDMELFKVNFMDVAGRINLTADELQSGTCNIQFMGV